MWCLNSSTNPSEYEISPLSIGKANYLPSNGHFSLFQIWITWTTTRLAASSFFIMV
jgi:hypothetical protein